MAKKNQCCSCSGSFFIGLTITLVFTYIILFGIEVANGVGGGGLRRARCDEPWRRFDYFMPAFKLGCWLDEVPTKKSCPYPRDEGSCG